MSEQEQSWKTGINFNVAKLIEETDQNRMVFAQNQELSAPIFKMHSIAFDDLFEYLSFDDIMLDCNDFKADKSIGQSCVLSTILVSLISHISQLNEKPLWWTQILIELM